MTGGMAQPTFYEQTPWSTLADLAALTSAQLADPAKAGQPVRGLASLDEAGPMHLTFFDNLKYADLLASTRAGACLVSQRFEASVPAHVTVLRAAEPFREFVTIARELYRDTLRPQSCCGNSGIAPSAVIDPTAHLEDDVIVDPLAVIGPNVEIGAGTVIGANAVIGPRVRIGRDAAIGANATIACALIGDRVIVHPGAHIGQDGFGFALGPRGHLKVPQIGRVVIQDDVEIGAGATIDRGANRDTVIGEGTKIDNLVQIGHNVVIGRHCIIVSQVGISGSCVIDDFVALGGQVGLAGHLHIGAGAQIGAASGVMNDVPAGQRWFGVPAQPAREHFREIATLRKLARGDKAPVNAPEKG